MTAWAVLYRHALRDQTGDLSHGAAVLGRGSVLGDGVCGSAELQATT